MTNMCARQRPWCLLVLLACLLLAKGKVPTSGSCRTTKHQHNLSTSISCWSLSAQHVRTAWKTLTLAHAVACNCNCYCGCHAPAACSHAGLCCLLLANLLPGQHSTASCLLSQPRPDIETDLNAASHARLLHCFPPCCCFKGLIVLPATLAAEMTPAQAPLAAEPQNSLIRSIAVLKHQPGHACVVGENILMPDRQCCC